MGGLVALALSQPFSSGQTKSRPWDTSVGNLVAHALGDRRARDSGPSDEAWGILTHDPHPSNDHPWYEHCKFPPSSIRPSCKIKITQLKTMNPIPHLIIRNFKRKWMLRFMKLIWSLAMPKPNGTNFNKPNNLVQWPNWNTSNSSATLAPIYLNIILKYSKSPTWGILFYCLLLQQSQRSIMRLEGFSSKISATKHNQKAYG